MSLEAQIGLITVPQEFSRLCNTVLSAEHGDDYLPIDDDRPDRGNDGYLKSEKRIFAAHCFKRVQNQSIDAAIRSKMLGDLGKAIILKQHDVWPIDGWTFISNYPVPDQLAEEIVKVAATADIDVAWRGPSYLAGGIRKHHLEELFPNLHVTQINSQLRAIKERLEAAPRIEESEGDLPLAESPAGVPRTSDETRALLLHQPPAWEYLLYAGTLLQGRDALESKWHDEELQMPRGERLAVDGDSAIDYLSTEMGRLAALVGSTDRVFAAGAQERAFGAPGEPGDAVRIENLASHVVRIYEAMLDWAAGLRAMVPPEEYERLFSITASLAHAPIVQFREFVDEVVQKIDEAARYLAGAGPEPQKVVVTLVLSLDRALVDESTAELDRLAHEFFG